MDAIPDRRDIDPKRPPENPGEGTHAPKWLRALQGLQVKSPCRECQASTYHEIGKGCITCWEYSELDRKQLKLAKYRGR